MAMVRFLKDAISLAEFKDEGTIVYRDCDKEAFVNIRSFVKDGIFFSIRGNENKSDRIPLHRITKVIIGNEVVWNKGIGLKNRRKDIAS